MDIYGVNEIKNGGCTGLNTDYYRVILKVAEVGNITKAATELDYTQSGISHIINRVEEELQQKIFARSREGVTVLPSAEHYLEFISRIVENEDQLRMAAHRHNFGSIIRLSVLPTVSTTWVPQLLDDFFKNSPDINFEIHEKKDYLDIINDIDEDISDIGFVTAISRHGMRFYPLYRDKYYIIFPKGHKLAQFEEINFKQIMSSTIIIPEEATKYKYFNDQFARIEATGNLNFFSRKPIDDWMTLSLVEQGFGISIVPGLYLYRHRYSLQARPLQEGYFRTLGLCTKIEKCRPDIRTFISFTRRWLKSWEQENPTFSC